MEVRTIQDIRALVRGRRADLRLSQADVAKSAGVSRKWLSMFEAGHETAEIGKVLALLDALEIRVTAEVEHDTGGVGRSMTEGDGSSDAGLDLRGEIARYYEDEG